MRHPGLPCQTQLIQEPVAEQLDNEPSLVGVLEGDGRPVLRDRVAEDVGVDLGAQEGQGQGFRGHEGERVVGDGRLGRRPGPGGPAPREVGDGLAEDGGRVQCDRDVEPAWRVGGDGGEEGVVVLREGVAEVGADDGEAAVPFGDGDQRLAVYQGEGDGGGGEGGGVVVVDEEEVVVRR